MAMDDAQEDADKGPMMETAIKLHLGIIARNTTDGEGERNSEYASTNDADSMVTIGTGTGNETTRNTTRRRLPRSMAGQASGMPTLPTVTATRHTSTRTSASRRGATSSVKSE